jgi:ssDNA-binding Zn-finger/Zn-ribbon topoisomerase 1
MVIRTNKANGSEFLGCTGWPDECTETMKLPAYVEVIRAGGQALPGFE